MQRRGPKTPRFIATHVGAEIPQPGGESIPDFCLIPLAARAQPPIFLLGFQEVATAWATANLGK